MPHRPGTSRAGRPSQVTRLSRVSPVAVILATGLVALGLIVAGTAELSRRAAATEAVADARQATQVLADSVVQPGLPRGLVDGRPGALDRFDRQVLRRLLVPDVRRVKVWDGDGTIVYSDKTQLIGETFPLDEDEQEVLADGGADAEVSDLSKPENRFERDAGGLLEVYTRVVTPEGTPLLLELYWSADSVADRQAEIAGEFRPVTLGALGLVVAVATALLWGLTRRLRRSAQERERLLRAAVEASEAERVRIARDLHDGVVQDLAGATFRLAALARREDVPDEARRDLRETAGVLRTGQRALRSLMIEIYPPDLDAVGLPAALGDLLAPAAAQGVEATLEVDQAAPLADLGPGGVRLVWRVAQEAVRNALRHADAQHLRVRLDPARRPGGAAALRLSVGDDGRGFDPAAPRATRFGLRGLAGLVSDAGGVLDVDAAPGRGTTVTLELEVEQWTTQHR